MAGPIRFGVFELDVEVRELRKRGVKVKLEQQPFTILLLLLERPGEVVAREELRARLWPDGVHVDFDRSLNKAMVKLRETLGDLSESPRFIETKPRLGYRFIAPVERGAAGARGEPTPVATRPQKSYTRLLIACAAIAVALAAAVLLWRDGRASARTPIRSIAVLPLQNLSGDPNEEFFSLGATDELISALGQIHAFQKVISRTSVMRYKGTTKSLPEIGRELGVDAVVEGSVERTPGRVRIRARLMDSSTEAQLWSKEYDREAGDLLLMEAEVAVAIAQEIRVQVSPQERARLVRTRRIDPAAQEEYLLGHYYRTRTWTQQNLKEAIHHLQRATEIDPNYAAPYVDLAQTWFQMVNQGRAGYRETREVIRSAALKAAKLDPDRADTHVALGILARDNGELQRAVDEFQRAIDLDPNNAQTYVAEFGPLAILHRTSEAIAAIERAATLDPLSPAVQATAGSSLCQLRRPDLAVPRLRKAIELDPKSPLAYESLAETYEMAGDFSEALKLEQEAERLGGVSYAPAVGRMYARLGRRAEALQVLERVTKPGVSPVAHGDFETALLYFALGKKDQAFEELAKALEARPFQAGKMEFMPRYDPLRSDPRFQALLIRFKARE